MKINEILFEMTQTQAVEVFTQYGFPPTGLNPRDLKSARNKIIFRNHPDRGGSDEIAKSVNVAYDILTNKSLAEPQPSPRGQNTDYGNSYDSTYNTYSGGASYTDYSSRAQPGGQDKRKADTPTWAWAGYSGGMPPNSSIYRQDYTDVNFIKKSMWELSGQSKDEYTIWGFDGHFFRGVTSVFGSPKIFNYMAHAMIDWETKGANRYECRAVFVSRKKQRELFLIYADGKFYGDSPIPTEHQSFNSNPGNDNAFMRQLPMWLDQIQKGQMGDPSRQ